MARILVIDDEPVLRDTLCQVLEEEGHEVLDAADGSEGLRLFRAQHPAVVLTDMLMPGMDGRETIQALRQLDPQVKIIAMSAGGTQMTQENLLQSASDCGARHTLTKPFSREESVGAVAAVLGS